MCRLVHGNHVFLLRFLEIGFHQQVRETYYPIQRSPDFMAHVGNEFRFCLVGSFGNFFGYQGFFGFFFHCDVKKDSSHIIDHVFFFDAVAKLFYPNDMPVFMDDSVNNLHFDVFFNQFFGCEQYIFLVIGMNQIDIVQFVFKKFAFGMSCQVFDFVIDVNFGPFIVNVGQIDRAGNVVGQ